MSHQIVICLLVSLPRGKRLPLKLAKLLLLIHLLLLHLPTITSLWQSCLFFKFLPNLQWIIRFHPYHTSRGDWGTDRQKSLLHPVWTTQLPLELDRNQSNLLKERCSMCHATWMLGRSHQLLYSSPPLTSLRNSAGRAGGRVGWFGTQTQHRGANGKNIIHTQYFHRKYNNLSIITFHEK